MTHLGIFGIRPLQIVDDEQVEQAIVVYVDPDGGNSPQRAIFRIVPLVEARLLCHIRERAVTIVVVESVAVNAGHENVRVTVVVIIADRDADIEARSFQARMLSDIGEGAVPVVAEEAVRILRRGFLQSRDVCAVREKDIGPAVAVVIEYCDTASHGFRNIFGRTLTAVEAKRKLFEFESDGCGRWGRACLLARQRLFEAQAPKCQNHEMNGDKCRLAHE